MLVFRTNFTQKCLHSVTLCVILAARNGWLFYHADYSRTELGPYFIWRQLDLTSEIHRLFMWELISFFFFFFFNGTTVLLLGPGLLFSFVILFTDSLNEWSARRNVRTHRLTYFLGHYDKLRIADKYLPYAYQLLSERGRILLSSYFTIKRNVIIVAGRFPFRCSRVSFRVALNLCSFAYGSEFNCLPAKLLRRFPGSDNIKNVELLIHVYGLLKLWLRRYYGILFLWILISWGSCDIISCFLFTIGLC
jgi:hypothetical protein